jgi:hypothetical protein
VTKTLDGSNELTVTGTQFIMVSYTYMSREFVSKPGEYAQGTGHQNIQNYCLHCACVVTQTLKNKKKVLQ